ncbi:MAG: hypothetical protein EI684_03045 [Candidatus Viridilinea halotolerans]|uniref:CcmD family protein n=1 Tax=Candidatus Viridilinea halotolerans TaxID=2491704 RepID=A0A426U868_9CHLR|nr:MAG: hypothetical protein EI684_03045 [Candidatus Viridilinea halotolerans]
MSPNTVLEASAALYVALAVALAVWFAVFVYLWRIDAQARELKRALEQQRDQEHIRPAHPKATLTRVNGEAVERENGDAVTR